MDLASSLSPGPMSSEQSVCWLWRKHGGKEDVRGYLGPSKGTQAAGVKQHAGCPAALV